MIYFVITMTLLLVGCDDTSYPGDSVSGSISECVYSDDDICVLPPDCSWFEAIDWNSIVDYEQYAIDSCMSSGGVLPTYDQIQSIPFDAIPQCGEYSIFIAYDDNNVFCEIGVDIERAESEYHENDNGCYAGEIIEDSYETVGYPPGLLCIREI